MAEDRLFSYWLRPDDDKYGALRAMVQSASGSQGAEPFEPHITLIGTWSYAHAWGVCVGGWVPAGWGVCSCGYAEVCTSWRETPCRPAIPTAQHVQISCDGVQAAYVWLDPGGVAR